MSLNETAHGYWQLAEGWLEHADNCDDINSTIAYTGMAECALKMAQFAVNNPNLVVGKDDEENSVLQAAQRQIDQGMIAPQDIPQGPPGGPKLWGSPS